jgi:GABA(A) receptor-associated protein
MGFKEDNSFEKRKNESSHIMTKYKSRIPIIVEKNKDSQISDIDKNKYLVPSDLKINQFMFIIRKRLSLKSHETIFLLINNELCTSGTPFYEIYEKHADEDGFLYIVYTSENTFG